MGRRPGHESTPATQALLRSGVVFEVLTYDHDPRSGHYGTEAASLLGLDPGVMFKTLIVQTDLSQNHGLVVGVVPVTHQLSMKLLARAVGAKKASMADPRTVQRSTGYVLGGVSPLGQKRSLVTVIDDSALPLERMVISGGRRGLSISLVPAALAGVLGADFTRIRDGHVAGSHSASL